MTEKDKVVDDKEDKTEIVVVGRPSHKVVKQLLNVDPCGTVVTLARMHGMKIIVPLEGISDLIDAFEIAKEKMIKYIDRAITNLERQLEEATKKIQEKKGD